MKRCFVAVAVAAAMATGGVTLESAAQAAPFDSALGIQVFLFGGHQYCWYYSGWQGPGWYWCGYSGRRGLGWGGPNGWNGHRYSGGGQRGGGHQGVRSGSVRSGHSAGVVGHASGGHSGSAAHAGGGHAGGAHAAGGGHSGGGHAGGGKGDKP
jgi:hypothetical protein